jgi:hypothetical protein
MIDPRLRLIALGLDGQQPQRFRIEPADIIALAGICAALLAALS